MTTENIDTRITRIEATLPHLATKSDIEALRADNASLRAEMYGIEARLTRWMVGTIIAMSVITSSVMTIIITIFRLLD